MQQINAMLCDFAVSAFELTNDAVLVLRQLVQKWLAHTAWQCDSCMCFADRDFAVKKTRLDSNAQLKACWVDTGAIYA